MHKYFCVGIKGTGVCAVATLLKDFGNEVVGSDVSDYFFTDKILETNGIHCYEFGEFPVDNSYTYIIGLAYDQTNEDVKRILDNNFEYYYYNDFIGSKLNLDIIAISGTHGKTTTTKFLSEMLRNKVSSIIGDGSGKGCKNSSKLVLEACEYKNHFLSYNPQILVINNIEFDHPDFFKNIDDVINTFQQITQKSNLVIVNGDDDNINRLKFSRIIKVGQNNNNDIVFKVIKTDQTGSLVSLKVNHTIYVFKVPFCGIHFVYDFVMAYVVCIVLGEKPNLQNISLPNRRMKEIVYGKTIIIDDYGHHPTEIKALYQSIRNKYPQHKINVIFQPHTYTRTLALKKEFKEALSLFDSAYLAKVFTSKRENEDTYKQLKINKIFRKYRSFNPNILKLIDSSREEVWVFLGAGIINNYIQKIIKKNENY